MVGQSTLEPPPAARAHTGRDLRLTRHPGHRQRPSQPLRSLQRPLANPGSLFQSQHFYGNKAIAQLSNKPALPISLKQMMAFGKGISEDRLIQSANFVRQELPVRIAHRVRDLQNLPFVVGLNPSLEAVYKGYLAAFEQVRRWPAIRTLEENDVFADFLKDLLESHWITIPRMMVGLIESQPHLPGAARERFMTVSCDEILYMFQSHTNRKLTRKAPCKYLQRMLRSRISRRVLAEQHIALTAQFHDAQEHGPTEDGGRHIGIINTKLSPHDSLTGLIGVLPLATGVSEANCDIVLDGNKTVTFAFIEEHLRYIVFELLKNSILAATEAGTRPHVTVTVADSPKVIGVRVSDQCAWSHRHLHRNTVTHFPISN